MGSIHVRDFKVPVRVGVSEEERSFPTLLTMQLRLQFDLRAAGVADDLSKTIDYDTMLQSLRQSCESVRYKLLERLLIRCAGVLFEDNDLLDEVFIEIQKPIFADTAYVSVSDTFQRSDV